MTAHRDSTERINGHRSGVDRASRRRERLITICILFVGTLVTLGIAIFTDLESLPRIAITVTAMLATYLVIKTALPKQAA